MGDVTGDWTSSVAHQHDVARVNYQVAVPKHRSPLAGQNIWIACMGITCSSKDLIKKLCA